MAYSTGLIKGEVSQGLSNAFKDAGIHQIELNKEYDNLSILGANMSALNKMFDTEDEGLSDTNTNSSKNSILQASDMFIGNDEYESDDSHHFLSSPSPDKGSSEEGSNLQEFNFQIPRNKVGKEKAYRRGVIDVLDFLQRHRFIEEFRMEGLNEDIVCIIPTRGMIPTKTPPTLDDKIHLANDQSIEKEEILQKDKTSKPNKGIKQPNKQEAQPVSESQTGMKEDKKEQKPKQNQIPIKNKQENEDSKEVAKTNKDKENKVSKGSMSKNDKLKEGNITVPKQGFEKKKTKQINEEGHKSFDYANTYGTKVTVKTIRYCKTCNPNTRKNATVYLDHLYERHSHEVALIKSLAYPL
ncbi:phosphoprotein [Bahia Grande virus]|uniref:Phosphoprotein n=1 Tax=Bahia Grande virus TaxID=932699 RepID=A0A0D3R1L6_9RHAB|nr:phosphoprotein [Bahia Grande virus]AJR28548.1 phosphoprotein [Bahia Grande virus]